MTATRGRGTSANPSHPSPAPHGFRDRPGRTTHDDCRGPDQPALWETIDPAEDHEFTLALAAQTVGDGVPIETAAHEARRSSAYFHELVRRAGEPDNEEVINMSQPNSRRSRAEKIINQMRDQLGGPTITNTSRALPPPEPGAGINIRITPAPGGGHPG